MATKILGYPANLGFWIYGRLGVNWYFEVPAKIAGVSKYQTLQQWYDNNNEFLRTNCKLAKAYYEARNWTWGSQCGTYPDGKPYYPLKTSQDLISGK